MPSTTRYKRGDIVLVPVPKVNVIPSVAEATLDCRLLPGTTRDQWLAASVDTENRQLIDTSKPAIN